MRQAIVLMLLAVVATPLLGENRGTWEDVLALKPGRKVQVVLMDLKSYQGRLESVSNSSISLLVRRNSMRFERGDVHRITTQGSRWKSALIGTAVGGLTGVVIGAVAVDRGLDEPGEGNLGKILFGEIGLAAGAGIGAAIPPGATVFRSGLPLRRPRSGDSDGLGK